MKTLIQTDKRKVTQIVTDIDPLNPEDKKNLLAFLYRNHISFDGIFIECNSHIAYVWSNKTKPKPVIGDIQA